MATVGDVLAALDLLAPRAKAAGWDAVGLQVGDPAAAAVSVAVCHEVTTEVVSSLERDPVDLLIAYHPLLFHPTRSFVAGSAAPGRAFRLARAGVALGVVHTAYDVAPGGCSDALANALGLTQTRGFGPAWGADAVKIVTFVPPDRADDVAAAMAASGAGDIGNYTACSFRSEGTGSFLAGPGTAPMAGEVGAFNSELEIRLEMVAPAGLADLVVAALVAAHPYEEPAFDVYGVQGNAGMIGRIGDVIPVTLGDLATHVGEVLETAPEVAGDRESTVSRVAVVPGSGGSFIEAVAQDTDVLVTGDVSHHAARRALDAGLAVIDAGHVPTERPGVRNLYAAVSRVFAGARVMTDDPHPWEGP